MMEAAFRGNEALALFLLDAGAVNEGVLGARPDALVLESEDEAEDRASASSSSKMKAVCSTQLLTIAVSSHVWFHSSKKRS